MDAINTDAYDDAVARIEARANEDQKKATAVRREAQSLGMTAPGSWDYETPEAKAAADRAETEFAAAVAAIESRRVDRRLEASKALWESKSADELAARLDLIVNS